jgi:hypothetical protein
VTGILPYPIEICTFKINRLDELMFEVFEQLMSLVPHFPLLNHLAFGNKFIQFFHDLKPLVLIPDDYGNCYIPSMYRSGYGLEISPLPGIQSRGT